MKEIPENSSVFEVLDESSASSLDLGYQRRHCSVCPYIPLPDSIDPIMRRLTKNKRQNLKRYTQKLEDKCKIQFKRYDEMNYSTAEAMKAFIELHQERWKSENKPGIFESQEVCDFHVEIASRFAEKDWLGLYFLMADDKPISVQYTFEYGHKMYYYQSGFDPEYSRYSVGNLMIRLVLEECIRKRFREYDMLRSNPSYKMEWTDETRKNFQIRFVTRKLESRFYNWITSSNAIDRMAEKLHLGLSLE